MAKRGEVRAFVDGLLLTDTQECILWPYSVGSHGYGDFKRDGKHSLAHRWVCEQAHGPAPLSNMDAAHSCGRDLCVNRKHLSWKSHADNCADKLLHGTQPQGESVHLAVLTETEAAKILATPKVRGSGIALAELYGVSQATVSMIRSDKTWKHLCRT